MGIDTKNLRKGLSIHRYVFLYSLTEFKNFMSSNMGQIFGVASISSSDTRKSLSSDEDFSDYENDGFEPVMSTKSKNKTK